MKLKPCSIITYCQSATTIQQIILTATATQLQIVRLLQYTNQTPCNLFSSCSHSFGAATITLYCIHLNTFLQHTCTCAAAASLYYCVSPYAAFTNSDTTAETAYCVQQNTRGITDHTPYYSAVRLTPYCPCRVHNKIEC